MGWKPLQQLALAIISTSILSHFSGAISVETFRNLFGLRSFTPPSLPSSQVEGFYDVIVVGGGASGCPFARTVAETGKSTLLIERGAARSDNQLTLDIFGAGRVVNDPEVSQLLVTTQGIRSHLSSVLGGGTATNLGISISEVEEFFDHLNTFPHTNYDFAKFQTAFEWVNAKLAHRMPRVQPYGQQYFKNAADKGFTPEVGYSQYLNVGSMWGGYSIFDIENNGYRSAADLLLGTPSVDMPITLDILLKHTVHKIEFNDSVGNVVAAQCVLYSETRPKDYAPINSRPVTIFGIPIDSGYSRSVWATLTAVKATIDEIMALRIPSFFHSAAAPIKRVCINPGGEIVLAAGTIRTPELLYKSGVGPVDRIMRLRIPLVKEVPLLGKNVIDRIFVPVGLFFDGDLPPSGFPPRICQGIGLQTFGPDCDGYAIGAKTKTCSLSSLEELSGGRISEGIVYATRFIFPPERRNDQAVSYLMRVLEDCGENQAPFGQLWQKNICKIATPVIHCFRKIAANLAFLTEPKSQGSIQITAEGELVVDGNYLDDAQDVIDITRSVRRVIEMARSADYDGLFEQPGPQSCPATILNGLIELMNNMDMATRALIPEAESLMVDIYLQNLLKTQPAFVSSMQLPGLELLGMSTNTTAATKSNATTAELQGQMFMDGHDDCFRGVGQRHASYPPALPNPNIDKCVENYVRTYMTSMWHWVGSAKMGEVVDDHFKFIGVDNLAVVDASVFNQVPRMNPFMTIIALGRYAALLRSS